MQELPALLQHILHTLAVLGGHRYNRRKVMQGGIARNGLRHLHGGVQIDLGQHQHAGNPRPLAVSDDVLLHGRRFPSGIRYQYDSIRILHGRVGSPDHVVAQRILRAKDPRRVQKHKLILSLGQDAGDTVAGGLRLGGNDGYLLPQHGVEQGGFSHVGTPHQGDKTGFFHTIFVTILSAGGYGLSTNRSNTAAVTPSVMLRRFCLSAVGYSVTERIASPSSWNSTSKPGSTP